jgi:cell division protein FtsW
MQEHKSHRADYILAFLVFGLTLFGLLMISSASVAISFEKYGHNFYYLYHQAIAFAIGILIWVFFQASDYRFLKKMALPGLLLTLVLLILVFVPGISSEGTRSWIIIGPVQFQPSELLKLTLIIYLAAWLAKRKEEVVSFKKGFLPFLIFILLIVIMIALQPDLGTLSIIVAIAAIMFFVAGASWKHIAFALLAFLALFSLLIASAPYRLSRFLTFINPASDPEGAGWQVKNALLAIGSGGFLGLGFGDSKQKYLYLPEAHTDSIFAIIVEELGFIRTAIFLLVFAYVIYRGFLIAKKAPDDFGKFLAIGITCWFALQAIVNIASMLGLLPLTGLTLPFVSYGGSSLVINLAAMGILLSISKYTVVKNPNS